MSLTTEDLSQIKTIVNDATANLATKDELAKATSGLATKAELKEAMSGLATKAELKNFATKDDLKRLATKDDLDRMESRLTTAIGLLERDSFTRLDQHEVRIARLEAAR